WLAHAHVLRCVKVSSEAVAPWPALPPGGSCSDTSLTSALLSSRSALCACLSLCLGAVPDAARKSTSPTDGTASTTLGAKKLATASQCSGAVAFSGAGMRGATKAQGDRPLALRATLLDKGVGWKPEDGEFVCYCPGTYQFAFAGDAAAKLVLKKKAAGAATWTPVVSGPQHVVLLDMELGETVAVFLEGGSLPADADAGTPTLSFSGFRVAKKQ
ncbi:Hibernation-associated plasma protein HP-27, partial [Frankliniella fusca]